MPPPPASVRLPQIDSVGAVAAGAVGYPLIPFPSEPWRLAYPSRELSQPVAAEYARWLNETEAGRLAVIMAVLGEAGAPVRGLPGTLGELGRWIQPWFELVAAQLMGRFIRDDPGVRLGRAWSAAPHLPGYSRYGDALLHSLAHDLAFVVADCARVARPGLRWEVAVDQGQDFFATLGSEPRLDLIWQVKDFLVQSTAQPRGTRGRALRDWRSQALWRCYQQAVTGVVPPAADEEFPDVRFRMEPRYPLGLPARSEPGAPPELVDAVAAFRRAGWFERPRLEPPRLARAARAAWRMFEREDIPLARDQMAWRLLLLDTHRTWSEDADAGIEPGDGIYGLTLFALEGIGGKGFGHFYDPEEDWHSRPGDLVLSFSWGRRKHRLLIPRPGPYLSPALITGLNQSLPADGQRLWFLDHGPPLAIVTRATAAERAALREFTGIRLDPGPPAWWTAIAPLPPPGEPGAVSEPVRPARPRPAPVSGEGREQPRAHQGSASAGPAPAAETAQQAFRRMIHELITPALRRLGMNSVGGYRHDSGEYTGYLGFQKSRYNTKDTVEFTINIGAAYAPTSDGYWHDRIGKVTPARRDTWWTLRAGHPIEPVAGEVLAAIRTYGWPAILAALDSPGFPPDPAYRWPRSFPPEPSSALLPAWADDPENEDPFTEIADQHPSVRRTAAEIILEFHLADPRAKPALLTRLASDPNASIRELAARGLATSAGQPDVLAELRAAAAQDEALRVRWACRYVIRLAPQR